MQNPNVFYEVGYAHAKSKLCILLTSESNDIPFDLRHKRHIIYGKSIKTLRDKVKEEMVWAKSEIERISSKKVTIESSILDSDIEKEKYQDIVKLKFKIDFKNQTDHIIDNIEFIYFYSQKQWELTQDGKECSFAESDEKDYSYRYFLSSPIRRLPKNSWSQIIFQASRVMARAWKGEELKDYYEIKGKGMIKIVTSTGSIQQDIKIKENVHYIPF